MPKSKKKKDDGVLIRKYKDSEEYGTSMERLVDALSSQGMDSGDLMKFLSTQRTRDSRGFDPQAAFMVDQPEKGRVYKDNESGILKYQRPEGLNSKGEPVYGRGVRISKDNVGDIVDNEGISPSEAMRLAKTMQDPAVAAFYGDVYGEPAEVRQARVLNSFSKQVGSGGSAFGRSAQQQDLMDSKSSSAGEFLQRCMKEGKLSDSCKQMMKNERSKISLGERLFTPMPGSKGELRKQYKNQSGGNGLSPLQMLIRTSKIGQ